LVFVGIRPSLLPSPIGGPVIVPNPAGGILLVGGIDPTSTYRTTILSLSSLTSSWTVISSSLKVGRYQQITLPFPYSNITTCTCKINKAFLTFIRFTIKVVN